MVFDPLGVGIGLRVRDAERPQGLGADPLPPPARGLSPKYPGKCTLDAIQGTLEEPMALWEKFS